jgi:hypothetical protein
MLGPVARLLNPIWRESYLLQTALTPDECRERLQAKMVSDRSPLLWLVPAQVRPIQGAISTHGFTIRKQRGMGAPNLMPEARGTFARQNCTVILVCVAVNRSATLTWLAGCLTLAAVMVLYVVGLPRIWSHRLPPLLGALMIPSLCLGMYVVYRWIGRRDDVYLLNFLVDTLEATERDRPLLLDAASTPPPHRKIEKG